MSNLVSLDTGKTIQSVKVTPKPPEEVCVHRQITDWLDPGWCMTPPTGSEAKVNRKRKLMLWWIAGVLVLLGLVGLVTSYPIEGSIHIPLLMAIVIVLVRLIHGGVTILTEGKENRGLTRSRAAALIGADDLARFEGEVTGAPNFAKMRQHYLPSAPTPQAGGASDEHKGLTKFSPPQGWDDSTYNQKTKEMTNYDTKR